ncbi:MAG: hypothetical protein QXW97_00200 [Candidatus Pacearchaeota archaeon]
MISKKNIIILLITFILIFNLIAAILFIKYSLKKELLLSKNELENKDFERNENLNNNENVNKLIVGAQNIKEKEILDYDYDIYDMNEEIRQSKNEIKELPKWISYKSKDPTHSWMNFYGEIKINGKPAEIGDKIAAFDVNETFLGIFIVKETGKYGFLRVYENDPTTFEKDGANIGDKIIFKVYDLSEKRELSAHVNNSVNPKFIRFEKMRVDLIAY